jgi:energy-coupling factor transporter transmembrane protein EcfT
MKHNSLLFLLLAFLYLIPVLGADNTNLTLSMAILAFINVIFLAKINFKYLFLFLILLLLPLISVFFTTILYVKTVGEPRILYEIGTLKITESAWQNAMYLTSRSFSLSFVSFVFILAINSVELVFSLMQNAKLSVNIGYPMMATFLAFENLKDEFQRIQTANSMRFRKKIPLFQMLVPLLVNASRHAYQVGLSLESRGLQARKTFIERYPWQRKDTIALFINLVQILIMILYVM